MDAAVVVKALLDDDAEGSFDQVFAEGQVLRQIDHPSIIRIQDCGYVDPARKGRPFLVMDFFAGQNLEEYVQDNGPLSVDDLMGMSRLVAQGMKAAHARHIWHRDIKPANLLVVQDEEGWQVKIIDFGLAMRHSLKGRSSGGRSSAGKSLVGHSIAGTIEYASPEQMGRLPGVEIGPYSDIYGFGKTCSFALFQTTQPLLKHWQSIPPPLAEFLENCLEEDPQKRPSSFANVLEKLAHLERLDRRPRKDQGIKARVSTALPNRDREPRKEKRTSRSGWVSRWEEEERSRRKDPTQEGLAMLVGPLPLWVWVTGGLGLLLLVMSGLLIMASALRAPVGPLSPPGGTASTPLALWTPEPGSRNVSPSAGTAPPLPPGVLTIKREGTPTFLTDLKEIKISGTAWLAKNGKMPMGEPMLVSGKKTPKGLCVETGEEAIVEYGCWGKATGFQTWAAIDDYSVDPPLNFAFIVLGDGRELWRATIVTKGKPQPCVVDLTGVQILQLRLVSKKGFHAVWIDPCVWLK